MELQEAVRTMGTCRYYRDDPVPDEVLLRAFDAARFAPQGGNRQPVRFVVIRDRATKRQLKEWYLRPWKAYLARTRSGEIPVGSEKAQKVVADADHFAEHLDEVPVLVVVCAVLANIQSTDAELDRIGIVGGGSVFPAVNTMLLTLREQGVGAAITTLLCRVEPQVKELLGIPDGVATAACVAVGYPERPFPTRLSRRPVEDLVFFERYGQATGS